MIVIIWNYSLRSFFITAKWFKIDFLPKLADGKEECGRNCKGREEIHEERQRSQQILVVCTAWQLWASWSHYTLFQKAWCRLRDASHTGSNKQQLVVREQKIYLTTETFFSQNNMFRSQINQVGRCLETEVPLQFTMFNQLQLGVPVSGMIGCSMPVVFTHVKCTC